MDYTAYLAITFATILMSLSGILVKKIKVDTINLVIFSTLGIVVLPIIYSFFSEGWSKLLSRLSTALDTKFMFNSIIDLVRYYMKVSLIKFLPLSVVIPTSAVWQFFALLFAKFYGLEEITTTKVISLILGFIGIILINYRKILSGTKGSTGYLVAIGLVLLISLAKGYLTTQYKLYTEKYDEIQDMLNEGVTSSIVNSIIYAVYLLMPRFQTVLPSAKQYGVLSGYFLIVASLSIFMIYYAMGQLSESIIVIFTNLSVIMSLIYGYFLFGEKITWNKIVGVFIIVGAIILMNLESSTVSYRSDKP